MTVHSDDRWLEGCDRARSWFVANERQPRQAAENAAERSVARWVNKQRQAAKDVGHHRTTLERQQLIESLPCWSWEPWVEAWDRSYVEYTQWVQAHRRQPRDSAGNPAEYRLAAWGSGQREAAFGTTTRIMTAERGRLLEAIPGWFWRTGYGGKPFTDTANEETAE